MTTPKYTKELLKEFDRLTMKACSQNQMDRIGAHFDMGRFVEKHGKEVCDAMFAELKAKDEAKSKGQES